MRNSECGNITYGSDEEIEIQDRFLKLFKNCPIPDDEIMSNLGLFINSKYLARILFLHHLYSQIIEIPGIIVEFGTRWGQNLSIFGALRGIYDTFHRHRKIVGFDTFEGFPTIHEKDGKSTLMKKGKLAVSKDYVDYLRNVMECQERYNPLSHIQKYEIIQGDAIVEFETYLNRHPETIVALAYFDFDIYEPTKRCLELLKPYMFKGSILGFDELNDQDSPGETIALKEVFDLNKLQMRRFSPTSRVSYFVL